MVKSLTARGIFKRCTEFEIQLWGGEYCSDGYFAATDGKHGDEAMIANYVQKQGLTYDKLHEDRQLMLF